ncbi:hypothetical protein HanOQP8_Chr02g0048721 [Helianthus annuus]|nr:hypothetical protein HanOQP8_Chr02g0048721 [Helianthus annuus]
MASEELAKYKLGGVAYDNGQKDGYAEGKAFALEKKPNNDFELLEADCASHYRDKHNEFDTM